MKSALKSSLYRTPFIAGSSCQGMHGRSRIRKRGTRLRGTSNARTFQVEQQMVAGCHSADSLVGFGGMEQPPCPWKPIWLPAAPPRSRTPCSTRAESHWSARDVTFSADAFSEEGRRSSVAAVEAVAGVRLVDDQTRLVDEAKPFVWSAEREVVRVTLSGNSPLPASKGKFLEAARADLGGVEVVDRMILSRGAPPAFRQCRVCCCSIRSPN